jgi:translation initiation factor IF-2
VRSDSGDIVFLDTPGHEAFTAMRARGADVTDLVILVVAADDGLMPQTVEAIDHARAANVPIIVAANKIDRPNANVNRIKQQLMEHNLLAEEFGGDTVIVPVSAKTGEGVEQLLEMVHLQAELMELKSVSEGQARGYVIESKMDRQRGPVATVLVQRGTLHIGDDFVAGSTHGRVRAMFDDRGKSVDQVGPSMPAEVLGYNELPTAGDIFVVMEDEKVARQIAQVRTNRHRAEHAGPGRRHVTLEDFLQGLQSDEVRELNMVLKADTQGSLEALRGSLEKQGNAQVRVNIIRAGVGGITETDISLATTANAVVMGFNVRAQTKAEDLSRAEGVEIKRYTVIYDLINDVHAALEGMLKPIEREEIIGHCEVRRVFSTGKEIKIAGAYVNDGHFERNSHVRLYRDDVLIHTGQIQTLRRFKDDVQSVQSGYECGVRIADFNELKEGDVLEAFITVEEAPRLERAE